MRKSRSIFAILLVFVMLLATTASAFAATEIRQTSETEYNYEGGKWVKSSIYSVKYNKNGSTKSSKSSYKIEDGWRKSASTYKYRKNGRIKHVVNKVDGKNSSKTAYNSKGNKRTTYSWKKGKWVVDGYNVTTTSKNGYTYKRYDAKKNLLVKSVSTSTAKKYTYKSYENGKLTFMFTNYINEKTGLTTKSVDVSYYGGEKYESTTTYKYNKQGLVTKEVVKSKYGTTTYTYKYSKFFDGNKNYPGQTVVYEDGQPSRKIVTTYKKVTVG